jgi:hypothetical protein
VQGIRGCDTGGAHGDTGDVIVVLHRDSGLHCRHVARLRRPRDLSRAIRVHACVMNPLHSSPLPTHLCHGLESDMAVTTEHEVRVGPSTACPARSCCRPALHAFPLKIPCPPPPTHAWSQHGSQLPPLMCLWNAFIVGDDDCTTHEKTTVLKRHNEICI